MWFLQILGATEVGWAVGTYLGFQPLSALAVAFTMGGAADVHIFLEKKIPGGLFVAVCSIGVGGFCLDTIRVWARGVCNGA